VGVRGAVSQPGQPEEERWIESKSGNDSSAGKEAVSSPSSVALAGFGGTRSQRPSQTHAPLDPSFAHHPSHKSSPDLGRLSSVNSKRHTLFIQDTVLSSLAYAQWPLLTHMQEFAALRCLPSRHNTVTLLGKRLWPGLENGLTDEFRRTKQFVVAYQHLVELVQPSLKGAIGLPASRTYASHRVRSAQRIDDARGRGRCRSSLAYALRHFRTCSASCKALCKIWRDSYLTEIIFKR
jgi:hypothetical protein